MGQAILFVVLIIAIAASTWYLGKKYSQLNNALLKHFNEIDKEFEVGLEKEAENVIESEPTITVSDLQKIMEYSPSKKERSRIKLKEANKD